MLRTVGFLSAIAVLLSMTAGCRGGLSSKRAALVDPPKPAATTVAAPVVPPAPAPPPPPPPPASVERLLVPGDLLASIVRPPLEAKKPPLTVFIAGICSNAAAYLHTFPEAARKTGGVVAIEGDQPCGHNADFHSYSWDANKQHLRIEAALAAAGVVDIPKEGITLVGYSQGAALAEQMVQRWPNRYARLVLIGAPTDPAPRSLARARAVVTMSCDRDVPARMKTAATGTTRVGTPATYLEMPGCTHGNVTEGERVFGASFDFLHANERPVDSGSTAVRIVGTPPPSAG